MAIVTNSLKPFKQLAATGHEYFRLEWFGGVKLNLNDESNAKVECFFTPLVPPSTPGEPYQRLFAQQVRADIGVGYLPALILGQTYQGNGTACHISMRDEEQITFCIDLDQPHSCVDTSLEDLVPEHQLRNSPIINSYSSASKSGIKFLSGAILKTTHQKAPETRAAPDSPMQFKVLLPEAELIRFYCATSEKLSKAVFRGHFNTPEWKRNFFSSTHTPPSFDPATGTGKFVYRHGYTEADIPVLSRALFDETGTALDSIRRIRNSWLVQSVSTPTGAVCYPRTNFPFRGKAILRLSGTRWKTRENLNGGSDYLFLAHRIISCSGGFPFKALRYSDEIEPGGIPADADSPAFSWGAKKERGPANTLGSGGNSLTDEKPSANAEKVFALLATRSFTAFDAIPHTREKFRDSTHRSEPDERPISNLDALTNVSTGDGTQGETSSVPQRIVDCSLPPSPVSISLENFAKSLQAVAVLRPEWVIQTIGLFGGFFDEKLEITLSEFPAIPCEKRTSILRQFSFMDEHKLIPRRVICAEIELADKGFFYLFEAERRPRVATDKSNAEHKEELSILLIRSLTWNSVTTYALGEILVETVRYKTWPPEESLFGFVKGITVHKRGAQNTDEIASRIIELIERNQ